MTVSAHIATSLRQIAAGLRQRRRLRLAIRAVWLALLVWAVGLAASLIGVTIAPLALLLAAGAILVIGLGYAWLSHPSLARLAKGLDRHYELDEQLATALEIARHSEATQVEARLLDETDTLLLRMKRFFDLQPLTPWREVETLLAVALLAIGLTLTTGPFGLNAESPIALPDLPPPAAPTETAQEQPTEQPVSEEQQQPELSPEAQQAANAIADALRDNGATRSAAESLDQGDTAGAASELRELADQADQLSDQARQDLAEGLRDAAEQLEGTQPDLANELQREADALEQGGEETAQALEDLARTVEQLGQQGQQAAEQPGDQGQQGQQPGDQGQGQQQSSEQQGQSGQPGSGAGNQLGGEQRGAQGDSTAQAEGEALPLPEPSTAGGPTTDANGPKGPTIELGAGGTGESDSGGGNPSDQPIQGEADPNSVPSEYRDVVEDYFTPQQ